MAASDGSSGMQSFVREVVTSTRSDFYARHYQAQGITDIEAVKVFSDLPIITETDFLATPFLDRIYTPEKYLVKVVYSSEGRPILLGRTLANIESEYFGQVCDRPMVLCKNTHEGCEKGCWYYAQNLLPTINEPDPSVTAMVAARYQIDGISAETAVLRAVVPELVKHYELSQIQKVTIVDKVFDPDFVTHHFPEAEVRYILEHPIVGSIGQLCDVEVSKDTRVFRPFDNCLVEVVEGKLVVTKMQWYSTPVIRFLTDIEAELVDSNIVVPI